MDEIYRDHEVHTRWDYSVFKNQQEVSHIKELCTSNMPAFAASHNDPSTRSSPKNAPFTISALQPLVADESYRSFREIEVDSIFSPLHILSILSFSYSSTVVYEQWSSQQRHAYKGLGLRNRIYLFVVMKSIYCIMCCTLVTLRQLLVNSYIHTYIYVYVYL